MSQVKSQESRVKSSSLHHPITPTLQEAACASTPHHPISHS
ncbi:hypothetical protein [Fischerella sp.]|nr:hypothetical protein [Fischerella sp.]